MLKIRLASDDDAPLVAAVIRESFSKQVELLGLSESAYPSYVGFETEHRVRQRQASGWKVVLASVHDAVVGTVSCCYHDRTGVRGEIGRLAVLPFHRGHDYGRALMQHAETQLISEGARIAALSIVAQFSRLRAYYEDLGYAVTGRKTIPSLPFELLVMERALTEVVHAG